MRSYDDKQGEWLVWRDDDEREDAVRVAATDAVAAAERAAYLFHAHRDGWEWSWPIGVVVEIEPTGKRWSMTVNRVTVPEFEVITAKEIR